RFGVTLSSRPVTTPTSSARRLSTITTTMSGRACEVIGDGAGTYASGYSSLTQCAPGGRPTSDRRCAIASGSGTSSDVPSRPRDSSAKAASIGGGGIAQGVKVTSQAAVSPPTTSDADAARIGDCAGASSAYAARIIQITTAAKATTPDAVTCQFARSGSR